MRQLWLPGLAAFLLSTGSLAVIQALGLKAWMLGKGDLPVAVVYVWWLTTFRTVGAVGKHFSRPRCTACDAFVHGFSGAGLDFRGSSA